MSFFKTFPLIALLTMMTLTACTIISPTRTITLTTPAKIPPAVSVEYIKSKITINKTTCDSIGKYFGSPIQKKFYEHVDYIFNENSIGPIMSLSINFNDTLVSGKTTVKSYIITSPGKGKIFSIGMDEYSMNAPVADCKFHN